MTFIFSYNLITFHISFYFYLPLSFIQVSQSRIRGCTGLTSGTIYFGTGQYGCTVSDLSLFFIFIIRVILRYPPKKKGVRYPLVGNLLHQVTFFSHLTVPSSHYAVLTSHVTVLFSHLVAPLLFSHI